MTAQLLLIAVASLLLGALLAVCFCRADRLALATGSGGAVLGCGLGFAGSLLALIKNQRAELSAAWTLPTGQFHVAYDSLSAFFLLAVFLVAGLSAIYGAGYLRSYLGKQRVAPALVFFNLLVVAMVGVVVARDAILFLIAWEGMTIASFFLVVFESQRDEVRRAGFTYLVASHLGAAFLFILFMLLRRSSGSYDFSDIAAAGSLSPGLASTCFLLALVGFGTKAGFFPFHIWLPDAHPAAPSHVSAVMSGVMIKMGIYGLLRVLMLLGPPQIAWGACLLFIGGISGVVGLLNALGQRDLKATLAYSSIENIGIIGLGLGIGLIASSQGYLALACLGYGGSLLHVLHHGLMKGLLFHCAGSVLHGTGTRNIDALGGLSRRMPWTAFLFLLGSVAICGLPPLCGFVSEWLLYIGAFRGGASLPAKWGALTLASVPVLALIGGLAVACFTRTFGVLFLGEPRTAASQHGHEAGPAMRGAMLAGALACALLGLFPRAAFALVDPVLSETLHLGRLPEDILAATQGILFGVALFLGIALGLALARAALLRRRQVTSAQTWGCGYANPTPAMQYTTGSFADPLLSPLTLTGSAHVEQEGPSGYFPTHARYEEHHHDLAGQRFLIPAISWAVAWLSRLRVLQQGRIHLYLAYILFTVVALLLWQLTGT